MTKQTKIIVGVVSVGVVLVGITLFFLMPRGPDLTIQAPAPPREVTPVPLPPPIPSVIAVKANLPIQDVKTLVESELRDYLSKPIQRKDGAIEYAIKLNLVSLILFSSGETVSVDVPFQFNGWARVSKKIFGQAVQKREDIEGAATASLTLTPTLNSDWRITAETTSDISIQRAEIEILGITISVRRILTELVREAVLPKLENLIVEYVTNIDVKTRVAGLWTKLHEPIVINQEPSIGLTVEPLKILAQQLSSDGQTLSFSLGIEAYIHANMGDVLTNSPPDDTITDLPDIRFVDALESGYHILAPIEITYTTVENLAKPHLEKPHKLKGIDTLVGKLTLYGSGTQLAAGIEFSMPSFGAEGQLYLLGTPIYDATAMSVSVAEFDYTLTTRSLFLDIAQAVGEGFFPDLRVTVEEKLVFPLEDQLTTLHKKLADVIAERRIGSSVVLRGTVDTITPEALYLTQTGVHIPFRLQGDLICEVNLNSSRVSH